MLTYYRIVAGYFTGQTLERAEEQGVSPGFFLPDLPPPTPGEGEYVAFVDGAWALTTVAPPSAA